MKNYVIYLLLIVNVFLIVLVIKKEFFSENASEIKTSKISLLGASGNTLAFLGVKDGKPLFEIYDSLGSEPQIVLEGGENPSLRLLGQNQVPAAEIAIHEKQIVHLTMRDPQGIPRMQLLGTPLSALLIRNQMGEAVGTIFSLEDGGAALGLADQEGNVSAFLRGGLHPSLCFFQGSEEPFVSVGITQTVPHFLLRNAQGCESILMHGGTPARLLFVNEEGKIPVVLSKYGLFQDKEPFKPPLKPKKDEDKVFSGRE